MSLQLAWPPVSGLDRLLTIVIPLTLSIELIAGFRSTPRWLAWLLRIGLALTIPRILLHGSVYLSGSGEWSPWRAVMVMALSGALLSGLWSLLSWLSRRSPGVSIPLSLCLTIQCAGMAVMMAGYIKGGAAAFPMAATLMSTTVASWLGMKRWFDASKYDTSVMLGVSVVGLFGVVFVGNAFGRISTGSALTMLLAPLLCWVSEVSMLRNRSPWLVGSIRLGLVAIPLIVVLAQAKRDFDRDMAPLLAWGRKASCEMRDARCEMRDARCEMRDARCEMRDARCEMRDASASCELRVARCEMRVGWVKQAEH